MNNNKLLKRVEASLKWKKSVSVCAKRLNLEVDTYLALRKQVKDKLKTSFDISQNVDLDKGTSTIERLSSTNPKTPEEIIKLLEIDTTEWKLSQYWNKQRGDKWLISALVSKIKKTEEDLLADLLLDFEPEYKPIKKQPRNSKLESTCGVLSVQDIHFGKHENETVGEDYLNAIEDLIIKSSSVYNLDRLYYVVGGDILNVDTFNKFRTFFLNLGACKSGALNNFIA